MRFSQRLRGFVGRGTVPEEVPAEPVAPPVPNPSLSLRPQPAPAPPPPTPTPAPAPTPTPAPAAINLSVEAAYAMLQAFPKEASEQQRLPALRTALSTMAVEKQKTLEQLLAEVLQEKARISLAVQNQETQFEAQVLKISEAVDALWDKRDKLTEHHQRLTLQAEERMEGLDQLIQCLSQPEEPTVELAPLDDVPEIVAPLVEEGPVLLGGAVLTPIKELLREEEDRRDDSAATGTSNRRRLYAKS